MVQIQRMLVMTLNPRPLSAIILQCLALEMAKELLDAEN